MVYFLENLCWIHLNLLQNISMMLIKVFFCLCNEDKHFANVASTLFVSKNNYTKLCYKEHIETFLLRWQWWMWIHTEYMNHFTSFINTHQGLQIMRNNKSESVKKWKYCIYFKFNYKQTTILQIVHNLQDIILFWVVVPISPWNTLQFPQGGVSLFQNPCAILLYEWKNNRVTQDGSHILLCLCGTDAR